MRISKILMTWLMLLLCHRIFAIQPQWQFYGPGGNSSIEARVVEIIDEDTVETMGNLHIYIYRSNNYSEPIAYFQLDSTGRFKINKLPSGEFDMILKKRGFISTKIPEITLDNRHRSRSYRPAISRISGIRNKYINLSICFKTVAKEEDKSEIIKNAGLEFKYTLKVKENFFLSTMPIEASGIPQLVDYFIQSRFIKYAYPEYNAKYADDVMAIGYKPIMDINDGTLGKGKGGDFSITVEIDKYKASRTADSFYIFIYPSNSYVLPEAVIQAAPNERKFKIRELPRGSFDLILRKKGFFAGKVCNIKLSAATPNASYNIPDLSEMVDMTKYLEREISVILKDGIPDSEGRKMISKKGCTVKDNKFKESFKDAGQDYRVIIPDSAKIAEVIEYFNNLPSVYRSAPVNRK